MDDDDIYGSDIFIYFHYVFKDENKITTKNGRNVERKQGTGKNVERIEKEK